MRFGVAIPAYGQSADGAVVRDLIAAAETLGFESAWWPDHIAVPDYATTVNLSPPFLEPLAACGWGLGATARLRFGTDVLVAPYRNPLLVAAMVGTLRADPGSVGLITALGWYATKHSVGLYSTAPPAQGFALAGEHQV